MVACHSIISANEAVALAGPEYRPRLAIHRMARAVPAALEAANLGTRQWVAHTLLCARVHTIVNALNVVLPYPSLCSHECEHGTHECVRHVTRA